MRRDVGGCCIIEAPRFLSVADDLIRPTADWFRSVSSSGRAPDSRVMSPLSYATLFPSKSGRGLLSSFAICLMTALALLEVVSFKMAEKSACGFRETSIPKLGCAVALVTFPGLSFANELGNIYV